MDSKALKIIHICQDEKFIDGAYQVFERAFFQQNKYFVLKPPGNQQIRYIKNVSDLTKVVNDGEELNLLLGICQKADLIVLYGLNVTMIKLVESYDDPTKFLWLVLGGEIYQNDQIYSEPLTGEATKRLTNCLENRFNLEEMFKNIYRKIRYKGFLINLFDKEERLVRAKDAFKSITFCGTLIEEEMNMLLEKRIVSAKAIYLPFTFYPLEYLFFAKPRLCANKENILIGNSGSNTNNHLEVFSLLKQFDLGSRNLVTPLSYGNSYYIRAISKEGKRLLGANFKPLKNFLPLHEYNQIVNSCGIVIMNHYRQQAVGNILSSLYLGNKVYLSERNVVYHYLKRIGCVVFSIEQDLVVHNKKALELLTREEVEYNKDVLKREISEEIVVQRTRQGILDYLAVKAGIS